MASAVPFVGVPGPMQRRLGAVVLAGQAPVIFFGALAIWGLAGAQNDPRGGMFLAIGSVIAVLAVVAAGTLRRPFGVTLGWIVQAAAMSTALLAPIVALVVGVFVALWVTALYQGAKMDALTAAHARAQDAA